MAQYLNFHFDPELFLLNWKNTEDLTLTALYDSGAVQENAEIASLIANGGDFYTIPFYDVLGGTPVNYDGATNITATEHSGTAQNGVVYGRANAWKARDFVRDFNSGADPLQSIASQVAKFWQKQRQSILLKILSGVFAITDDSTDAWDAWQLHTTNLATTSSSATAANRIAATTVGDAIQKAVGDNGDAFGMAIMHSAVANALAKLDLLEYRKYTDANGIQRPMRIADINGMAVIIDDGVPVKGLTHEQIADIAHSYGEIAGLAKRAGFEMVTVHGGHGWLLNQFFSPLLWCWAAACPAVNAQFIWHRRAKQCIL